MSQVKVLKQELERLKSQEDAAREAETIKSQISLLKHNQRYRKHNIVSPSELTALRQELELLKSQEAAVKEAKTIESHISLLKHNQSYRNIPFPGL